MRFDWDEKKDRANVAKHKVGFELAILVFDDVHAITTLDCIVDGEHRWQTIGNAAGQMVMLVVHTDANEEEENVVRIITARKATPTERRRYEETFG